MPMTAARLAPAVTPTKSGEARGLRSSCWKMVPEAPSARPTASADVAVGSRRPRTTKSTLGSSRRCSSEPTTSPRSSRKLPSIRVSTNRANTTAASSAGHHHGPRATGAAGSRAGHRDVPRSYDVIVAVTQTSDIRA